MAATDPFSDEQSRTLVNLQQHYDAWMNAEQALQRSPYNLARKEVKGRSYLYEITDRGGNGRSLGPWTPENEARFERYRIDKADAQSRRDGARAALGETCRLYRALRLPLLASDAGDILRHADRRELLGSHLIVIGTNALPAYAIEAAGLIRAAPDETQDFDLAWASDTMSEDEEQPVWDLLKAVDPTYTVNSEKPFQARNTKAYEVELLVAPSRAATSHRRDRPRPVALPEQEWLLNGRGVSHAVVCRDGSPARIAAPDPRWFALHKLWMSEQAKRNPLKRPKDRKQGIALLDAIDVAMPHYPLDDAFRAALPGELQPAFAQWAANRPPPTPPRW